MFRLDETNGRCYELSGRAAVSGDDPDITLVHGTIYHPAHEVYPHAWTVSGDGTVHDHVLGTMYPSRSAHEEACDAKYLTTYTPAEAGANMGVYNHWGPWNADTPPRVAKMTKCGECGEDDLIMEGSDLCGWCEDDQAQAEAEAEAAYNYCNECGELDHLVRGECEDCSGVTV